MVDESKNENDNNDLETSKNSNQKGTTGNQIKTNDDKTDTSTESEVKNTSTESEVKNTAVDATSKMEHPETVNDNKSDNKDTVKPDTAVATNYEKSETDKINSAKSTDQGNVSKSEAKGSPKRFVTIVFLSLIHI